MMKTIIKRELLDYLRSIQFVVLLIVSLFLFIASGVVFMKNYSEDLARFHQNVNAVYLNPSTTQTKLYREPNPLQFISEGGNKYRPIGFLLKPKGALSALPSGPRNFKLPDIPDMDWAFIIKVVFSLYVILLGFQSISGEREQGTLRLVLANRIGRIHFIVAKYVAILLTMAVPVILGFAAGLVVIGSAQTHVLSLSHIFKVFLFFVLTMIYLSIFAFISLLFSSFIPRSSLVLLILLAVWVLFAVIIPNTSSILSKKISPVPSEYQVAKRLGPLTQKEVWDRIQAITQRAEKGEFKTEDELKREAERTYEAGQQKLVEYYEDYDRAMKERARTAQNISRLSPTALFQYSIEEIVQTGNDREEKFLQDVRNYSRVFDRYIQEKLGRLVAESNTTFSTGITFQGKYVDLSSPRVQEYQGPKTDFPRFAESHLSLMWGVTGALSNLAGLLIWNLMLATLGFAVFLRADVR